MTIKKTINLTENDLLKVEQIVIDRDKEGWGAGFRQRSYQETNRQRKCLKNETGKDIG